MPEPRYIPHRQFQGKFLGHVSHGTYSYDFWEDTSSNGRFFFIVDDSGGEGHWTLDRIQRLAKRDTLWAKEALALIEKFKDPSISPHSGAPS